MMQIKGSPRLVLILAIILVSAAFRGTVAAADRPAAEDAIAAEASEEKTAAPAHRTEAAGLLDSAREELEKDNLAAAERLLRAVEDSPVYRMEEPIKQRADQLRERLNQARAAAEKQREKTADQAPGEVAEAKQAEEKQSAEASEKETPGAEVVSPETAEKETAQRDVANQREKVAAMLDQAQTQLVAGNVDRARQILEQARQTGAYQRTAYLQSKGKELQEGLPRERQRMQEFENVLSQAQREVEQWDFDAAETLLAGLEGSLLYRQRDSMKKDVVSVRQRLKAAREEIEEVSARASKVLDEAEQQIESGEFHAAREQLQKVKESAAYQRRQAVRQRTSSLSERLRAATEETVLRSYEAARRAYEEKNYATALKAIEEASQHEESLDPAQREKLAQMRQKASSDLKRCEELYERGRDLYSNQRYAEAKETFEQIRTSGVVCSDEVPRGVDKYMSDIDEKIQAEKVAEARRYEEAIGRLEEKHERILQERRQQRWQRREAMAHLNAARESWSGEDFETAKGELQAAREKLQGLPVEKDPDLKAAREEVEEKLTTVDERMAARRRREALKEDLQSRLAEARELQDEDLRASEQKLIEALNVAQEHGIGLTESQQAFVDQLNQAIEDRFGDERRRRAERYGELVREAGRYADDEEWQKALQMLEIVEKQDRAFMTMERRKKFQSRMEQVRRNVAERRGALERIDELTEEADRQLKAGRNAGALQTYRQALVLTGEQNVPLTGQVKVLEGYEAALQKSRPELMEEFSAQLQEVAERKIAEAIEQRDYLLARAYLESGSPDAAREHLQKTAGSDDLDQQKRSWARQQLQGIEEKIQELEEQRLLAGRDEAKRIYDLQQEFEEAVERNDEARIERLHGQIAEARVNHLASRMSLALKRDAYPVAVRMLERNEELVMAHRGNEALEEVIPPVRRFENIQQLVQKATRALRGRDADAAAEATLELKEVGATGTPYEVVAQRLQEASQALVHVEAQKQAREQKLARTLSEVQNLLARARNRQQALDQYFEANELFARGEWKGALDALDRLGASPKGLKPFEVERLRDMMVRAGENRREQILAEERREAQRILSDARGKLQARELDGAESLLKELREMPIYQLDEDIRQAAEQLQSRVEAFRMESAEEKYVARIGDLVESRQYRRAADLIREAKGTGAYDEQKSFRRHITKLEGDVQKAEKEARDLYRKATSAYEDGESERLEKILQELSSKYKNTTVYAENL